MTRHILKIVDNLENPMKIAPLDHSPLSCLNICSDCLTHLYISEAQANIWTIVFFFLQTPCFLPPIVWQKRLSKKPKISVGMVLPPPVEASEILLDSVHWAKVLSPQPVPLFTATMSGMGTILMGL